MLLACFSLAACSPTFDWRTVPDVAGGYEAAFPARPLTQTRTLELAGQKRALTWTSAIKNGAVFGVGHLAAAPTDGAVKTALLDSFLVKLGASATPMANPAPDQAAPLDQFQARGTLEGQPAHVFGRFVTADQRLYIVVVLGPTAQLPSDAADTFLMSFRRLNP